MVKKFRINKFEKKSDDHKNETVSLKKWIRIFLGDFMPTIENEGASVIEFDLSALKSKCASNNKWMNYLENSSEGRLEERAMRELPTHWKNYNYPLQHTT